LCVWPKGKAKSNKGNRGVVFDFLAFCTKLISKESINNKLSNHKDLPSNQLLYEQLISKATRFARWAFYFPGFD